MIKADPHGWTGPPGMTPGEAAGVILAERDRIKATTEEPALRAWLDTVAGLMVAALEAHRKERR